MDLNFKERKEKKRKEKKRKKLVTNMVGNKCTVLV
jgi:hypothetical protein